MGELLTAAEMRAAEAAAIARGAATGRELMERAGRAVAAAVRAEWPELARAPHRAVVLCGPGNNGGDGYVVARELAAEGWEVTVAALGDPGRLPPDAAAMRAAWQGATVPADPLPAAALAEADLVVDALFGTGLARPLEGLGALLAALAASPARVVAVDVPSGLCADSGRVLGRAGGPGAGSVRADLTVTFHRAKPGHYLAEGPAACGRLVVADIGIAPPGASPAPAALRLAAPAPALFDKRGGHKYAHGHALILAGGPGEGGAARLSARGALRIGAGLVTVACPLPALAENAARLDTVMLRPLHDGAALARLLDDRRFTALCLGPGMGYARARDLVPVALGSGRAVVLDADALSAWAEDPRALFARLHPGVVLTPHGGEFARLFPDLAERLSAPATAGPAWSKVEATREAARRAGCTVLHKGPDTVIAAPDGRAVLSAAVYERAAPWLATAGSGDVLAGFICGLLARGLEPLDAAEAAAWAHVEAARAHGPGLIAEDLPEMLPRVFRGLGL
jgi:hydroxyethylthiazole kinase-like uncharacterized protein yjeF